MIQELKIFEVVCIYCEWKYRMESPSKEDAIRELESMGWQYHKDTFWCPVCKDDRQSKCGE